MKRLLILLLLSTVASAQVTRYISPSGTMGATGVDRAHPWSFDRAVLGHDTTIIGMDGTYLLNTDPYVNWSIGTNTVTRTRWIADSGAIPIVIRANGAMVGLRIKAKTTIIGFWFHCEAGAADSTQLAISSSTQGIECKNDDSLMWCVIGPSGRDGLATSYTNGVKVINCLFANAGHYDNYSHLAHAFYGIVDTNFRHHRNVFVGSHPKTYQFNCNASPTVVYTKAEITSNHGMISDLHSANSGWAIQWWHDELGGINHDTCDKNFIAGTYSNFAVPSTKTRDMYYRDNILWSTYAQMGSMSGFSDASNKWTHNFTGRYGGRNPVWTNGGNAASIRDSNVVSWVLTDNFSGCGDEDNGWWKYTDGTHSVSLAPIDYPTYLGTDTLTIDNAAINLADAFWKKTATQVRADTANIRANWQTLLNAVDVFSGYTEQSVQIPYGGSTGGGTTHTITASAGAGGSIDPSGAHVVNDGEDHLFTIAPNPGYHIADVTVDGGSQGAVPDYTFYNVTTDHTITATFAQNGRFRFRGRIR